MSVQLMSLAINSPLRSPSDSFTSDPGSSYNKGALAFLQLVEKVMERNDQLNFPDLIIQMMDLQVGERVPTPDSIAHSLNKQGWDAAQVSSVWCPASMASKSKDWTADTLMKIGGSDVLVETWSRLKSSSLTGFPKRAAPDRDLGPNKRWKQSTTTSSKVSNDFKESNCNPDIPVDGLKQSSVEKPSPILTSSLLDTKQSSRRRVAVAKRSLGAREKITWWLSTQQTPPPKKPQDEERKRATPRTPSLLSPATHRTPSLLSPDMFLQTPENPHPEGKKRRRRHKKQKKTIATSPPTVPSPSSQSTTALPISQNPASPLLNPVWRKSRTSLQAPNPSEVLAKKTSIREESSCSRGRHDQA